MLAACVAVAWAAAWTSGAAAQNLTYSADLQRCLNASTNWTAQGMVGCWSAELDSLEAQLDRAYRETLAAVRPEARDAVRNSQEAWSRYREVNCGAWAGMTGSAIDPVGAAECRVRLTAQRVVEVADMRNY